MSVARTKREAHRSVRGWVVAAVATVAIGAGGAALAVVGIGGAPAAVAASSTPTPVATEPPLTATDYEFLASMRRLGMSLGPDMESNAVYTAKRVCEHLDYGRHALIVMDQVQRDFPALTPRQVGGWVGGAIGAYCPQYGYQLGFR